MGCIKIKQRWCSAFQVMRRLQEGFPAPVCSEKQNQSKPFPPSLPLTSPAGVNWGGPTVIALLGSPGASPGGIPASPFLALSPRSCETEDDLAKISVNVGV